MQADLFKSWASEVWILMTAWWADEDVVAKSNQLIEELGEDGAFAEATKNALDVMASPSARYFWNKVVVCVSQEVWRRNLTF